MVLGLIEGWINADKVWCDIGIGANEVLKDGRCELVGYLMGEIQRVCNEL